jgi:hypothetical protein
MKLSDVLSASKQEGLNRRSRPVERASAGARPRQGNSRHRFVADHPIDARCKRGKAPDAHSVMRYPILASELDHRRLQASLPPMHDHSRSPTRSSWGRRRLVAPAVVDNGHQSGRTTPPRQGVRCAWRRTQGMSPPIHVAAVGKDAEPQRGRDRFDVKVYWCAGAPLQCQS